MGRWVAYIAGGKEKVKLAGFFGSDNCGNCETHYGMAIGNGFYVNGGMHGWAGIEGGAFAFEG